jgi:hypothetical protein
MILIFSTSKRMLPVYFLCYSSTSTGYREPLEGQDDDSPKAQARRKAPHRDWRLAAHNEAPLLMAPYGYSCKPPQCGNPSGPGVMLCFKGFIYTRVHLSPSLQ